MARSGRSMRRRYVLGLLVLTALTLVTLDQQRGESGALGSIGRIANEVVGPIRSATDSVASPIGHWFDGVFSAGSLDRENEELRRELAREKAKVARAQDAIEENQALKAFSDLTAIEDIDRISARVVAGPPGNFERSVIIDKGSSSGIRLGLPVVAGEGLFGRVVMVSPHQAKVLLITDEQFSVSVRTTSGRDVAIASGRGASTLRLEFVQSTTSEPVDLVRGDAVVTSGLAQSLYPAGLPVGEIASVSEASEGTTPSASVRPFVDFGAVEFVQVLDWDPARDEQLVGATPTTVGGP